MTHQTHQEALAIRIRREKPATLACIIARNIKHCSDCPANNICVGFDKSCANTIEEWLKQKEGD